tara:strand:- start:541 stop:999 length:459 start_codon:yes stop_codon:yes gene_type:complete
MKLSTDRTIPISTSGPNLGIEFFKKDSDANEYMFIKGKSRVDIPLPAVIKVSRQGGSYSMVEFFYEEGRGPRAMDIYDGKTFVVVTLPGDKRNKTKTGVAYRNLVCTGKLRDTLKGHPNIRFDKFVCQTEGLNHWNDVSLHLDGLGAPKETL